MKKDDYNFIYHEDPTCVVNCFCGEELFISDYEWRKCKCGKEFKSEFIVWSKED